PAGAARRLDPGADQHRPGRCPAAPPGGRLRRMPSGGWMAWALAMLLLIGVHQASAQSFEPRQRPAGTPRPGQRIDQPALISADTLTVDRELGTATATGHVEIAQGERVLLADTVSYNQRTGAVTASGHVSLMEPSGDVLFADYVELDEG